MASAAHLRQALRLKLSAGLRAGHGALDDDTALFTSGLFDSLAVMDLVAFIEGETGRRIPAEAVTIENFDSIGRIVAFMAATGGVDGPA
jgi:acyl carrier protein